MSELILIGALLTAVGIGVYQNLRYSGKLERQHAKFSRDLRDAEERAQHEREQLYKLSRVQTADEIIRISERDKPPEPVDLAALAQAQQDAQDWAEIGSIPTSSPGETIGARYR